MSDSSDSSDGESADDRPNLGRGKFQSQKNQPSGSNKRTVFVSSSSSSMTASSSRESPTTAGGNDDAATAVAVAVAKEDDSMMVEQKFAGLIQEHPKSNKDFRLHLQSQPQSQSQQGTARPILTAVTVPMPSDIGAWQKHTKGIGLKLLQKFGFTGRLGAKEDGRIRPVDVVSRPMGEGLGFTDLSSKKEKYEARGASTKGADADALAQSGANAQKLGKSSRAPPAEDVVDQKSWKRGRSEKVKILSVADFLGQNVNASGGAEQPHQVILDMRGEKVRILNMSEVNQGGIGVEATAHDAATSLPKLGQEMLYNVNLVVDLMEADVIKFSKKSSVEMSRMASCKADIMVLEKELARDVPMLERISKIIDVLARIEAKRLTEPASISLEAVVHAITSLYDAFNEEFRLFGILQLLPSLADPILQAVCVQWNPMQDPSRIADVGFELSPLVNFFADRGESALANQTQNMIETMVDGAFLPIVRRSIANDWDVQYPDNCLCLLRTLNTILPDGTMRPVLEMMIQPKLLNGIKEWNSQASDSVPMHLWILPWWSLLGNNLAQLFPDVRRKLGQELKSWHVTDPKALASLSPWLEVFDTTSTHHLLIRSVVPKLIEGLRSMSLELGLQDNTILKYVLEWHGIIPLFHLTCLLEGEFFPQWHQLLSRMLQQSTDFEVVSEWYTYWKNSIPDSLLMEEKIRQPFNVALEMMNECMQMTEAERVSTSMFDKAFSTASSASYMSVVHQRKRDAASAAPAGGGVQPSRQGPSTLKEMLELFAAKNEIIFVHRANRHPDGHLLFSFGCVIVYWQNDVIFAKQAEGGGFHPISLQNLLGLALQRTS